MVSTNDAAPGPQCAWRPEPGRTRAALAIAALLGLLAWPSAFAQHTCNSGASSMPGGRFTDNGDGTVTDGESKLMWMRCASGQTWSASRCAGDAGAYDWAEALQQADKLNRDGVAFFNDWRVPALRELATITDRGCRNPRTNMTVFPGTRAAPFWSSTPRPGEAAATRMLVLDFGAGGVLLAGKQERFHLRLVRTGP